MEIDSSVLSAFEPYWMLLVLVSGIYAALFKILWPRRTSLPVLWIIGAAGFLLAQILAERFFSLTGLRMGESFIVDSSILDWALMLIANRVRV